MESGLSVYRFSGGSGLELPGEFQPEGSDVDVATVLVLFKFNDVVVGDRSTGGVM